MHKIYTLYEEYILGYSLRKFHLVSNRELLTILSIQPNGRKQSTFLSLSKLLEKYIAIVLYCSSLTFRFQYVFLYFCPFVFLTQQTFLIFGFFRILTFYLFDCFHRKSVIKANSTAKYGKNCQFISAKESTVVIFCCL